MDTVMEQDRLEEMMDQAIREVAEKSGLHLQPDSAPPTGELCTVHITFKKGFRSSLIFYADSSMFARMVQDIVQKDHPSEQDIEDFSKEYFNVLCGRIAALFYDETKVPVRFSVPSFYKGRYEPEGQEEQFSLSYSTEKREGARLIHYVPSYRVDKLDQTDETNKTDNMDKTQ